MSVVVDIIDTFPAHDILAVGRVKLNSLLIISGVLLKYDELSNQYSIQFPYYEGKKELVEICDEVLKEKVYDAMVFKYEQFILLQFQNEDVADKKPYIYQLEKQRIKNMHQKRHLLTSC